MKTKIINHKTKTEITGQTKEKEKRVFVLQKQSRYDVSAVKFYSSHILYIADQENLNPFDTTPFAELVEHKLKMNQFDPDNDFICLTGSSVLLSIFLAILVRQYSYCGQFKILVYDARRSKYQLRLLNLR